MRNLYAARVRRKQFASTLAWQRKDFYVSGVKTNRMRKQLLAVLLLASLVTGCSTYTSEYLPPQDGRARAVWDANRVVVHMPSSLPRCRHQVVAEVRQKYGRYFPSDPQGYYVPPPPRASTSIIIIGSPVRAAGPPVPLLLASPAGKGGDAGAEVLAVLAVAAILTFPFVAVGLATGKPEKIEKVVSGIDKVNKFNDDARRMNALCYATAPLSKAGKHLLERQGYPLKLQFAQADSVKGAVQP